MENIDYPPKLRHGSAKQVASREITIWKGNIHDPVDHPLIDGRINNDISTVERLQDLGPDMFRLEVFFIPKLGKEKCCGGTYDYVYALGHTMCKIIKLPITEMIRSFPRRQWKDIHVVTQYVKNFNEVNIIVSLYVGEHIETVDMTYARGHHIRTPIIIHD